MTFFKSEVKSISSFPIVPNFEFDFSAENRQSLVNPQQTSQDDDFGDFETANQEPINAGFEEPISAEKSKEQQIDADKYSYGLISLL